VIVIPVLRVERLAKRYSGAGGRVKFAFRRRVTLLRVSAEKQLQEQRPAALRHRI